MPALVPGVQPFAAFTGTYTLSADQESITIGASPAEVVATPWYDMGVGATLARVQWDGTATGTIQGRSSSVKPPASMAQSDTCLILPGSAEWDTSEYYSPGLGTLPAAQGWTDTVTGETLSGGYLTVPTTGNQHFRRYGNNILAEGRMVICNWRMSYESGTGDQGVFCRIRMGTGVYSGQCAAYTSLTNTGAIRASGAPVYVIPGFAASTFYDFCAVFRTASTGTRPAYYEIWWRPASGYSQDDLTGYALAGQGLTVASNDFTEVQWGGVWIGGTTCRWGMVRTFVAPANVNEFGFETVTDGDTSFARNHRYWQIKGWTNGTLTEVDLASDLAAPGNPSGPEAAAVGASAIGGNCTALASGAAAYYLELLDAGAGDAVIDARWELEPSATFRGLTVPGNFKVRFTSASDDGVRGSASVTTDSTAVPVSTAAATAPTIGPYPRWVSGELRFYKPTAGTTTLTGGAYAILSAAQAAGSYTVADSNSWASITWRATDGVGQYVTATDLGMSVSDTAWYRDRITDSGNLVAEGQTAAYGGDTANAYCAITFTGLTAGTTVACRLSDAVTLDGVTYPAGPYSATVDGSGNATLSVPRTDAGTPANGDGVPFGYFTGGSPTSFVLSRRIPDSATATFASLVSP
jgi:hypothetical protein